MRTKILLWRIGLLPTNKCPLCKNKTIGHGYDEWGEPFGYYTCKNNTCKFNQEK